MFAECFLASRTRVELVLKLEPLLQAKAKANLVTSTGGSKPRPLQNSVKADTVNTQKELETASGISHDTISKGKVIEAKASNSPMPLQRALVPRWRVAGACLDRMDVAQQRRVLGQARVHPRARGGVKCPPAGV